MASIDAFLELAEASPDPKPWPRASMWRARERPRSDAQRRERTIAVLIVIVVEVALLLVLRTVMRPVAASSRSDDRPVLISFVTLPKVRIVPMPVAVKPVVAPRPDVNAVRPRTVSRVEGSRVATAPPTARSPAPSVPSTTAVQFYSRDGELLVPPAASTAPTNDLLAHRSMDGLLPGSGDATRADFHVNTDSKAKRVVDFIAKFTGGGPYDPCPELAQDMVNLDDRRRAEMAVERYEQSCEGH